MVAEKDSRRREAEKSKNQGRTDAMKYRWQSTEWENWRRDLVQYFRERESQTHRENISRSKRGNPSSLKSFEERERVSTTKGGIMGEVYSLHQRAWDSEDIIQLGYERRKVTNAFARMRKSGLIRRPSEEDKMRIMQKSHKKSYDPGDRMSSEFARKIIDSKMYPQNLECFEELKDLYLNSLRTLPPTPSELLRLEVFLKAVQAAKTGNRTLLAEYNRIGRETDPKWFELSLADEEDFIIDTCEREPRLADSLPMPIEGYPSKIKKIVELIDQVELPLEIKEAFLTYLTKYAVGKAAKEELTSDEVALKLGISKDKAVFHVRKIINTRLDDNGWRILEELSDKILVGLGTH